MRYYIKEKTMTNDKIEYELKGLYEHLHLDEDVYDYCSKIEKSLKERFEAIIIHIFIQMQMFIQSF